MIHRVYSLSMTQKLREISPSPSGGFPHLALNADLSRFPDGYSPWHWHEAFEFCTLAEGRMELSTPRSSLQLCAGDGYFVNANVLHMNRALSGGSVLLCVHQFGARLLGGGDAALQRYVSPIGDCATLEAVALRRGDAAQREILDALDSAFAAAGEEPFGYELRVAECLTRAWLGLARLTSPLPRTALPPESSQRIKRMLSFIHAHYAEPVTVADIAAAGGVGERECYRCFQRTLGIAPVPYLTRQRIDAAARLLTGTGRTIADIAADCGFSSPSYFCSVFHSAMGASPREFRKNPDRGRTGPAGE